MKRSRDECSTNELAAKFACECLWSKLLWSGLRVFCVCTWFLRRRFRALFIFYFLFAKCANKTKNHRWHSRRNHSTIHPAFRWIQTNALQRTGNVFSRLFSLSRAFYFCAVMFCSAHVCFLVRQHHFLRFAIRHQDYRAGEKERKLVIVPENTSAERRKL